MKYIYKFICIILIFAVIFSFSTVSYADREPCVVYVCDFDENTGILTLNIGLKNVKDCNCFSLSISYPKNDIVYEKYTPENGTGGLSADGNYIVCSYKSENDFGTDSITAGVFQFRVFDGTESADFETVDGFAEKKDGKVNLTGKITAVCSSGGIMIGDADLNGKITVADARYVLKTVAKLIVPGQRNIDGGDVNFDKKITVADARKILRVIAKLEEFDVPENHIHLIAVDSAVAPSCTKNGLTEGSHCKICGKIISARKTVDALGHNFINGVCARCGQNEYAGLTPQDIYRKAQEYSVEIKASSYAGTALGTGFFISDDGKAVTNFHVIDGAEKITVKTFDGKEYEVKKVLAYNKKYDIAVLKTDLKTTPAVLNKNTPVTGDTVYTLGSSQGLTETFTNGIVSSASRKVESYSADMMYIQVTAPITNGNSGGPLINGRGEVIGITTWGITTGQNMNFATPVSYIDELDFTHPLDSDAFNAYCNGKGTLTVEKDTYTVKKGETVKVKISYSGFNPYSLAVNGSTRYCDVKWDTEEHGNAYEGYFYLDITATAVSLFKLNFEVFSTDNYSLSESFKVVTVN